MHNATKFKMKLHTDDQCKSCQTKESLEHYLLDCPESRIGDQIDEIMKNKYYRKAIGKIIRDDEVMNEIYNIIERDL